jgi:hypothetical protein
MFTNEERTFIEEALLQTFLEDKWLQKASKKMKSKGTEGSFSARAAKEGKTTAQLADEILGGKHKLSKSGMWRKRANFASVTSKMRSTKHHK